MLPAHILVRSNPSIRETKNKVRGLDRSGKSDHDPWLMWWCHLLHQTTGRTMARASPRLRPGQDRTESHPHLLISFNFPFSSLCLLIPPPSFDFSLFGRTRLFEILRSRSFSSHHHIIIILICVPSGDHLPCNRPDHNPSLGLFCCNTPK